MFIFLDIIFTLLTSLRVEDVRGFWGQVYKTTIDDVNFVSL